MHQEILLTKSSKRIGSFTGLPQALESLPGLSSKKVKSLFSRLSHTPNFQYSREAERTSGEFDQESRGRSWKSSDTREDQDVARIEVNRIYFTYSISIWTHNTYYIESMFWPKATLEYP